MDGFKLGRRGQEAAPFNLIIAGIMITFTMVVLAYLAIQSNTVFCMNELRNNVEELARGIEKSAQFSGNRSELTVNLNFQSCGDIAIKNFTISKVDSTNCIRECESSNCRLILTNGDFGGSTSMVIEPICIKIPFNTTITSVDCQKFGSNLQNINDLTFQPKLYNLELIKTVSSEGLGVNVCEVK